MKYIPRFAAAFGFILSGIQIALIYDGFNKIPSSPELYQLWLLLTISQFIILTWQLILSSCYLIKD